MDEIWERAVETALEGQTDKLAARTLTLDGAVKCIQGRLPTPSLFEKFENLQHLSIANIGVSTLEQFPRLRNLVKLILSDNRISGGLEFLVEAGLDSLRDLDLSNNRIQYIEDLAPLARLRLVSLDLYECPVTRLKDYRSRVFGLISSLKYLDKMDAEENERPESDDEEEDDDEEDEEDDPGSGEVDGEERPFMTNNGHSEVGEGIVDEEEESEADEETETETGREINGVSQNGFRVEGEEEEEVDNEEGDLGEPESTGRLTSTEGEIDGHEQGEDVGEEDDNGETGEEEEQGVDDDGEFDEEDGEEERKRDDDEGEDDDDDVVEYMTKSSKKHH
ncbi:ACIDIC LEUCINE-RICH NUCLEAR PHOSPHOPROTEIN 32 [Salix purpurea]|uniref:ACIDIC LEUCINE-RICH NUCLEAR PHOSPHOPROTEIN 32 n=1 Tax=Salix purpurea TaxID=77065 RepID=A0A9Q1AKP7_SALPP|nr:ACIDIC LEUCINE-RICH NUCLEAR PHOSPHOPROTEIN 32 [Salix purpurea]